jgi:hypothetical protein
VSCKRKYGAKYGVKSLLLKEELLSDKALQGADSFYQNQTVAHIISEFYF